jgi:hypothetical protein
MASSYADHRQTMRTLLQFERRASESEKCVENECEHGSGIGAHRWLQTCTLPRTK